MADAEAAKAAEEAAEKAEYLKVGTRIAPYPGTLLTIEEVQELSEHKDFLEPMDAYSMSKGRTYSYQQDQDINGYTLVSPQYAVVERGGYFYKIGQQNLDLLAHSTQHVENPTIGENVYRNSRGVIIAWAFANKGIAWAADTFGGPLGGAAAPVLNTAAEQGLQEDRRAMAYLEGQDFNEEKIEVNGDTMIDSAVGFASNLVGSKISKSADKFIQGSKWVAKSAPLVQRAAKMVPHLAGAAVSKEIAQTGEVAKSAIHGKGISPSDFVPSAGIGDIEGLIEGAVTSWLHKGWSKGRTPKAGAPSSAGGTPEAKAPPKSSSDAHPQKPAAPPENLPRKAAQTPEHAGAGGGSKGPPAKPPRGGAGGGDEGGGKKKPPDPQVEAAFDEWGKDLESQGLLHGKHDPKDGPVSPPIDYKIHDVAEKARNKRLKAEAKAQRRERGKERKREEWERKNPEAAAAEKAAIENDPKKAEQAKAAAKEAAQRKSKYQKDMRAATKGDAEAEAHRHDVAVKDQPAMTRKDMYNKTIAMRGFDAGAPVHEGEKRQNDYDAVKKEIAGHPDKPKLDDLQKRKKQIDAELAKINRKEKKAESKAAKSPEAKQPKLGETDQKRKAELEAALADVDAAIEKNPVTALNRRANGLRDKIAVSTLTDPDHPTKPARLVEGAPAGRGDNTYAVIQVVGPDGTIVASATGKRTGKGHAEQNAIPELERQIKQRGGVPPGSHVEVVGDQVVCTEVCKPALSEFATNHDIERVDGYTYHAEKPGKKGEVYSAKSTAQDTTTAAARPFEELQEKHEKIYERGKGPLGGGTPTEGEKHRHAQKVRRKAPPSAKAEPSQPHPADRVTPPQVQKDAQPAVPAPTIAQQKLGQQADEAKAETTAPSAPESKQEAAPKAKSKAKAKYKATSKTKPKSVKTEAKSAEPAHTPSSVKTKSSAPSKSAPQPTNPPSSKGQKITAFMGKADAVLGAVRDFKNYKADGMSELEALTRSGATLAANLKGGPAAAVVNSINVYDNERHAGQGKVEALATAIGTVGGGLIANKVAPAGPVGTAVNLANTASQALGAPQGIQDATTGAAALVPSNIVGTTITEGARSYANIGTAMVTGDTKALDKQVQGMQAGNAGPWLQGYAQMTGMVADVAAGDSFDKALNKAADSGRGSWADRVGSKGGDALYELGESKEAKSGKYGAPVQGISMSLGIASDMIAGQSFEQALDKAADAGRGSWAEKAGSALGDVAWSATEKTKQLVGSDIPAAKKLIKNKWQKLWS